MGAQGSRQGLPRQGTAQGQKYKLTIDKDCFTKSIDAMGDSLSFYDIARSAVLCSDRYKEQQEKIIKYQEMTKEDRMKILEINQEEKLERQEEQLERQEERSNLGIALQEKKDELTQMFDAKETELISRTDLTIEEKKEELQKFTDSMKTNWDTYVSETKEEIDHVSVNPTPTAIVSSSTGADTVEGFGPVHDLDKYIVILVLVLILLLFIMYLQS